MKPESPHYSLEDLLEDVQVILNQRYFVLGPEIIRKHVKPFFNVENICLLYA